MARIIQAYRRPSPIADAVRDAASSFFANRLGSELQRQQLEDAQAKNEAIDMLGSQYGPDIAAGVRAGLDPGDFNLFRLSQDPNFDPASTATTAAQIGSGMATSSSSFGFLREQARLRQQAAAALAEQQRQHQAALAQDQSQFGATMAETQRQFNQTPVGAVDQGTGQRSFVPQGQAATSGLAPIASETEAKAGMLDAMLQGDQLSLAERKQIAGIEPQDQKAAEFVLDPATGQSIQTFDGLTDARTGAPLPPNVRPLGKTSVQAGNAADAGFTTSTDTGLQGEAIALRKFNQQIAPIRQMATELGPTGFGPAGALRRWAQTAGEAATSLDVLLGGEGRYRQQVNGILSAGLDPANPADLGPLFDPNLPKLESAANLLIYSAAAALASQEGRGLSDNDVKMFRQIVGNPVSLFSSQADFLARLDLLEDTVAGLSQTNRAIREGGLDAPVGMNPQVLQLHGALEQAVGKPLPVNSGFRTPEQNAALPGAAPNSEHLNGNALDIDVSGLTPDERLRVIQAAQSLGFTGIGTYDNHLHIDVGRPRAWGQEVAGQRFRWTPEAGLQAVQ